VGIWSLLGFGLMLLVSAWWPTPARFAQAIAAAGRTSGPDPPAPAPVPGPPADGPDGAEAAPTGTTPAGTAPWPDPETQESAARAGRHNAAGAHRAGSRRVLGLDDREETQAGTAGRNTGPRATDDMTAHPTSPSAGAGWPA
jgi:hypothetical protein